MEFLRKIAARATCALIARAASSEEAFDRGRAMAFPDPAMIRIFFHIYGTTERKCDYHPKPGFFIGYVKTPQRDEFLAVIFMQPNGSVVASFETEYDYGQDLMGLMARKTFADEVAARFVSAAA